MKAFTVEWVHPRHIEDPERGTLSDGAIPVVRLDEVDAVIAEAVWAMKIVIIRIQYKNDKPSQTFNELEELCMKDSGYRRAHAFLASPLVAAWRGRQQQLEVE